MDSLLTDQSAFRPTGSTTAALISILQKVTTLLDTNTCVTVITLDFNKAFDMVWNSSLACKLSLLDIPYEIYYIFRSLQLVCRVLERSKACLYKRQYCTRIWNWTVSLYDICSSAQRAIQQHNYLDKLAHDTYLIVPYSNRPTVQDELDHISTWAKANHLHTDTQCAWSTSIYTFRVLRAHGLPLAALHKVARATTLARLL